MNPDALPPRCIHCHYDLTGLAPTLPCPECGEIPPPRQLFLQGSLFPTLGTWPGNTFACLLFLNIAWALFRMFRAIPYVVKSTSFADSFYFTLPILSIFLLFPLVPIIFGLAAACAAKPPRCLRVTVQLTPTGWTLHAPLQRKHREWRTEPKFLIYRRIGRTVISFHSSDGRWTLFIPQSTPFVIAELQRFCDPLFPSIYKPLIFLTDQNDPTGLLIPRYPEPIAKAIRNLIHTLSKSSKLPP